MRKRIIMLAMALCVAGIGLYAQLPFAMPDVAKPNIPSNTVNITAFGAKGDGTVLCTEAFAKAMKALSAKGGGRLVVPAGIWLTGPDRKSVV